MAINTINEVTINKISSTQFETEKIAGNITTTMENNEVFIFTDDKVYTQAEKSKLEGIATGADESPITSIKKNGTALNITGKSVDISVPTKTSDLINDSNFVADSDYNHTDNNYTNAEKTKLEGIETAAEVNVIESVKRNGTALNITGKSVDISVPTKTSDLTNDSNFITDPNYTHTDACFTAAEKTKLEGIETAAEVNTIETVKLNGTALTPDANKAVNIEVAAITKIWS